MLIVTPNIRIPRDEFAFSYVRSSGPGGQNVNKVNSKAVLRWSPTTSPGLPEGVRQRFMERFASRLTGGGELVIASERFRDQRRNADDCLEKLRTMLLAAAEPPKARKKTKPGRGAHQRRLESKRRESEKKRSRRRFDD